MSESDFEEEMEGWIEGHRHGHSHVLTPGPHMPRHMHAHMKHGGHRHSRNDENEMSDRLRYNINYM